MEYIVQASSQSFEEFGARRDEREMSENWILRRFPNSNSISLHDYRTFGN